MTEIHQAPDSLCAIESAPRGSVGAKAPPDPGGELSQEDVQTNVAGGRAPVSSI